MELLHYISVRGIDTDYLFTSGYEVKQGRSFCEDDIYSGRNLALIGSELAKRLFKGGENPLQKEFSIGNGKYKVIGVLAEKGSGFGGSSDMVCFIPYSNSRSYFSRPNMNFDIQIKVSQAELVEASSWPGRICFSQCKGLVAFG